MIRFREHLDDYPELNNSFTPGDWLDASAGGKPILGTVTELAATSLPKGTHAPPTFELF
jgi:hypothetical protein